MDRERGGCARRGWARTPPWPRESPSSNQDAMNTEWIAMKRCVGTPAAARPVPTWPLPFAILLGSLLAAGPLMGQHAHGAPEEHSSYAGLEGREIAALADQELDDLLEGRGMGLALAAELNGVPGPMHVLELARELELTPEQEAEVQAVFDEMLEQAKELGGQIVEVERELDRRFRHQHLDETVVRELTGRIGALTGELRAVHLNAHLKVAPILTSEQRERYVRLRGYEPTEG
jgi:Spy/CpxP family protein refolding chaperone